MKVLGREGVEERRSIMVMEAEAAGSGPRSWDRQLGPLRAGPLSEEGGTHPVEPATN